MWQQHKKRVSPKDFPFIFTFFQPVAHLAHLAPAFACRPFQRASCPQRLSHHAFGFIGSFILHSFFIEEFSLQFHPIHWKVFAPWPVQIGIILDFFLRFENLWKEGLNFMLLIWGSDRGSIIFVCWWCWPTKWSYKPGLMAPNIGLILRNKCVTFSHKINCSHYCYRKLLQFYKLTWKIFVANSCNSSSQANFKRKNHIEF